MRPVRLAIVHWFPVEYYPPVTNLMNCFATNANLQIVAYTSHNVRQRTPYTNENCQIRRYGLPLPSQNRLLQLWRYLYFPLAVFFELVWQRPQAILYFEPQSALPVVLYSLVAKRCRILIHHHEYHDPHQFLKPGMRLVRFYHWLESRLIFKRAEWISHTNQNRVDLFQRDFPVLAPAQLHELPNLPPQHWFDTTNTAWREDPALLRLVYVGSLSGENTFIAEIVQWLESDAGANCSLDVYSYNHSADVLRLFENCNCDRLTFHSGGIPYDDLPRVLSKYHVGLILYRATTTNYVFNASNKLFEYLALNLDVWYPQQMLGVKPYARTEQAPRVIELDFHNLADFDPTSQCQRSKLEHAPVGQSCESALAALEATILMEAT